MAPPPAAPASARWSLAPLAPLHHIEIFVTLVAIRSSIRSCLDHLLLVKDRPDFNDLFLDLHLFESLSCPASYTLPVDSGGLYSATGLCQPRGTLAMGQDAWRAWVLGSCTKDALPCTVAPIVDMGMAPSSCERAMAPGAMVATPRAAPMTSRHLCHQRPTPFRGSKPA